MTPTHLQPFPIDALRRAAETIRDAYRETPRPMSLTGFEVNKFNEARVRLLEAHRLLASLVDATPLEPSAADVTFEGEVTP